jgi:D-alanyl-D-alanine endopeptidase (penicillin-binding protein 7)
VPSWPRRQRKKVAVAKKPMKQAKLAGKPRAVRASRAHRAASLEDARNLSVKSAAVLVLDQSTGAVLFEKNAQAVLPIASITKLMTAMVALDARPDLNEILAVSGDDVDVLKGTRSRLTVGTRLTREEMFKLALMSSEKGADCAASSVRHQKSSSVPPMSLRRSLSAVEIGLPASSSVATCARKSARST